MGAKATLTAGWAAWRGPKMSLPQYLRCNFQRSPRFSSGPASGNGAPVVSAYHACFRRGRVTPGMHIIMEIEHLCTVQDFAGTDSDSPANNRDWKTMGRHFSDIRKQCPQLEGVGGSEAIYEWLNY